MTTWEPPGPGPWQQDSAHMPVSQTAVLRTLYPDGFNRGFTETFSRYGVLLDRLAMAQVNGFTYHQPQPFDLPGPDGPKSAEEIGAEFERRLGLAHDVFETRLWRQDMELWEQECKPASLARHREFADLDLAALSDAELADHLRAVAAHVTDMVYQHHRFNMAAILPVGDLALHVAQWTGQPPQSALALLNGYSPVSGIGSVEVQRAAAAVSADAEAERILRGQDDPQERLAELRATVPAVDEYLRTVGHRLLDGFDVVNHTVGEHPEIVLGKLVAALDGDPDAARVAADQLADEVRTHVPDEHRSEFDQLLDEARLVYRLRDERGMYSEISAIGLLRLAMLEIGRRAAARGALHQPDDALDASIDEAVDLLGGGGPSADELSARAALRHELTAAGAPRFLGPPAPEPSVDGLPPALARLMSATGFMIDSILGQLDDAGGDEGVVIGLPANGGVVEGPARLIRHTDDLLDLQEGEIVVTPTTGEAFNSVLHLVGAIVTDHGSHACHAAIVAREMGFPAVVGTVNATARIRTGDRVRVDGAAGEVTLLP